MADAPQIQDLGGAKAYEVQSKGTTQMRSVANTLLSTRNYESSDRNNIVSPFTSSAGINSSNISN